MPFNSVSAFNSFFQPYGSNLPLGYALTPGDVFLPLAWKTRQSKYYFYSSSARGTAIVQYKIKQLLDKYNLKHTEFFPVTIRNKNELQKNVIDIDSVPDSSNYYLLKCPRLNIDEVIDKSDFKYHKCGHRLTDSSYDKYLFLLERSSIEIYKHKAIDRRLLLNEPINISRICYKY